MSGVIWRCACCDEPVKHRTIVSWPRFRVRQHIRCTKCWVQWELWGHFMRLWFGL